MELEPGYEIRAVPTEEFMPLWKPLATQVFDEVSPTFYPFQILSEADREKERALKARMGNPYQLNLGLFHQGKMVGWNWGFQQSSESFYMCNAAVLPEHRRKGFYTAMMKEVLSEVTRQGFRKITSRHIATNNSILIPKLRAGFIITSFELSDNFGLLVHLTYFPDPVRRKMMEFRAGAIFPDEEIKKLLRLT